MTPRVRILSIVALACLATGSVAAAQASRPGPAATPPRYARSDKQCFSTRQLDGWRAVDGRTVYIRVVSRGVYRLDLIDDCSEATWPGARLITRSLNGTWACGPDDLELEVSNQAGNLSHCRIGRMSLLSRDEVLAPAAAKPAVRSARAEPASLFGVMVELQLLARPSPCRMTVVLLVAD